MSLPALLRHWIYSTFFCGSILTRKFLVQDEREDGGEDEVHCGDEDAHGQYQFWHDGQD